MDRGTDHRDAPGSCHATARSAGSAVTAVPTAAILGLVAFVAISSMSIAPAEASDSRPVSSICEREKLPGRGYIECLETALRDSDRALIEASLRAQAQIEARSDLAVTQRTRWKNVLEEAQGQFIRFRNFECQNVAPYEGSGGRIGAFEERLACLVEKNTARRLNLLQRYGNQ
jgi:uncharacterized protein YecT (DUF1311 family)